MYLYLFTPDHETTMVCVCLMKDWKRYEAENLLITHHVGVGVFECVCRCMCVVFTVCVTVFISHLSVTVYCGIPVDHQCVVKLFKLTNKTFVTKMRLSRV